MVYLTVDVNAPAAALVSLPAVRSQIIGVGTRQDRPIGLGNRQPISPSAFLLGNRHQGIVHALGFAMLERPHDTLTAHQQQGSQKHKRSHLLRSLPLGFPRRMSLGHFLNYRPSGEEERFTIGKLVFHEGE